MVRNRIGGVAGRKSGYKKDLENGARGARRKRGGMGGAWR